MFTGLGVLATALNTDAEGVVVALEEPDYLRYWALVGQEHANKVSRCKASNLFHKVT